MGEFHYRVPMEHMNKPGEWVLALNYRGQAPQTIKCPDCNGIGHYTGFRAMHDDEPEKCKQCYGCGQVRNPEWVEPKPPQWLVDQLSKVMCEMHGTRFKNEEFKLT